MNIPLLISLFFSNAFGIIGSGIGLNALIESNRTQSRVRKIVPAGTTVDFDISDVFDSGVVSTVCCLLIAITSSLAIFHELVATRISARKNSLARKIQGGLMGVWTIWLFATQIPFTAFFANREAGVTASIAGRPIPKSLIDQLSKSIGVTSVYKDFYYRKTFYSLALFI
jgi:hypothetical protein